MTLRRISPHTPIAPVQFEGDPDAETKASDQFLDAASDQKGFFASVAEEAAELQARLAANPWAVDISEFSENAVRSVAK